ncbi:MAG: hypothetical protein KGJ36_09335, partial [Acidobacteriota bacterium]|nr:hypothetical protein [Acidobacteriota bacterium]
PTRSIAVLALLALIGVGAPALAGADTSTTVLAPTTTSTVAPTFAQQLVTWHAAVAEYNAARRVILRAYDTAVRRDARALAAALEAGHGKASQKAALATFHAAIKAAKRAKIAALLALGAFPVRPTN